MGKSQAQQVKRSSRKVGRNKKSPAHMRSLAEHRWTKHKINRLVRYCRKFPNWKLPADLNDEVKTAVQVRLKKIQ